MASNDFNTTVGTLFNGMDSFLTTKTVIGEPTTIGNTIILPLVDVSFAVAAGAFAEGNTKNSGAGGLGGKMSPSAVLVIQDGHTKLVNIKNQDSITKILDMVPELIDKVADYAKEYKEKKDAEGIEADEQEVIEG
ncbi:MAG: GerW family sporulation protein [Lachnospiraceae bacterium]|nr:GerW family sporulation protein [Lachnospiraceae bacterium]